MLSLLMLVAALVVDVGTKSQARAQEQFACDSSCLAGMAQTYAGKSAASGVVRANATLASLGYVVGQNGILSITQFPHNAASQAVDETNSDRFTTTINRKVQQYFTRVVGISTATTETTATAAVFTTVPIDASFNDDIGQPMDVGLTQKLGFPLSAQLSAFGPDAKYSFGDSLSTKKLDSGAPNPNYAPAGRDYDLVLPLDLKTASGSSRVRVEIFDADCVNKNDVAGPTGLTVGSDLSEPSGGTIDEYRGPTSESYTGLTPSQYLTQTEYKIVDANGTVIATASYGPLSNTPWWFQRQSPLTDTINTAGSGDHAQSAVDLHWITPQGFDFDTAAYKMPFKLWVRTTSGSSENAYSLRVSTERPSGAVYDPITYGTTPTSALSIYAAGRIQINFAATGKVKMPIGTVPSTATKVNIQSFDSDMTVSLNFSMTGFDKTSGTTYPVLFPASTATYPNGGTGTVRDSAGNSYWTQLNGSSSGNGAFLVNALAMPPNVIIPKVDANGALLLDANGRVITQSTSAFQGGDLLVNFNSTQSDTTDWTVTYQGGQPGSARIVLIR